MAALLHEVQVERGMSAICAASSGRHFRRELARQRERANAKRDRLTAVRRELAEPLGATLARRFEKVDAQLRAVGKARAALDAGRSARGDRGDYSAANLELLGIGDGALVAFAPGPQHRARLPAWSCSTPRRRPGSNGPASGPPSRRSVSDEIGRRWRRCCRRAGATASSRPPRRALQKSCWRGRSARRSRAIWCAPRSCPRRPRGRDRLDARGWLNLTSRKIELLDEVGLATLGLVAAS